VGGVGQHHRWVGSQPASSSSMSRASCHFGRCRPLLAGGPCGAARLFLPTAGAKQPPVDRAAGLLGDGVTLTPTWQLPPCQRPAVLRGDPPSGGRTWGRRCHRSPTRPGDRGGCALGQSAAHGSGPRGLVDQLLQRLLQRVGVGFGGRRGPAGRRWVGSTCACRPAAGPQVAVAQRRWSLRGWIGRGPRRTRKAGWNAAKLGGCHGVPPGLVACSFRLGMYLRGTPTAHARKT
jgi:hypothetical protein